MPHPPTRQMEAKSWSWTSASALGAYASRRQGTVVFGSGLAGPGVLGGLLAATWPIPWNGSSLRLRTFTLFFQLEDLGLGFRASRPTSLLKCSGHRVSLPAARHVASRQHASLELSAFRLLLKFRVYDPRPFTLNIHTYIHACMHIYCFIYADQKYLRYLGFGVRVSHPTSLLKRSSCYVLVELRVYHRILVDNRVSRLRSGFPAQHLRALQSLCSRRV